MALPWQDGFPIRRLVQTIKYGRSTAAAGVGNMLMPDRKPSVRRRPEVSGRQLQEAATLRMRDRDLAWEERVLLALRANLKLEFAYIALM